MASISVPVDGVVREIIEGAQKIGLEAKEKHQEAQPAAQGFQQCITRSGASMPLYWPILRLAGWVDLQMRHPLVRTHQNMLERMQFMKQELAEASRFLGPVIAKTHTHFKDITFADGEGNLHLASFVFLPSSKAGYVQVAAAYTTSTFKLAPNTVLVTTTKKTFWRSDIQQHVEFVNRPLSKEDATHAASLLEASHALQLRRIVTDAERQAAPERAGGSEILMYDPNFVESAAAEREKFEAAVLRDDWSAVICVLQGA